MSFCRPRTCGPIYFCQHTLGWWRDMGILPGGAINRCNRCRLRHFMWELMQESNRRSLFCRLRNPIPGPGRLKDQKLPVVGFVRCFELEPLTMVKLEAIVRPARQMESICSCHRIRLSPHGFHMFSIQLFSAVPVFLAWHVSTLVE